MKILSRLFGKNPPSDPPPEHAVIVRFAYGSTDLAPLHDLTSRLEGAIARAQVGEYDGDEIATDGDDATLYMYGPDADALFSVVRPILIAESFMAGGRATLRYGPPDDGVPESTFSLEAQ